MVYQIAYNPYKVAMRISVKIENRWIPVGQNSTLARFSRVRLQRCLSNPSQNSFFYELCASAGDNEIDISFLGTDEDYTDFQEAVSLFNRSNPNYHIALQKSSTSNSNDTKSKYETLSKIMLHAKEYKYSFLISDKIWEGINYALTNPSNEWMIVPLTQWKTYKPDIFSYGSWKMFCFEFRYEDLKSKSVRTAFRELSKEFEQLSDRPFEIERFEFICWYSNSVETNYTVLKKALMEYGIQDINHILINETDYSNLNNLEFNIASDSLKELWQHIMIFKKRYASQYKLRKSVDIIQKEIQKEKLIPGPKLKRRIDTELRDQKADSINISDSEVEAAYEWLICSLNSISHILELET